MILLDCLASEKYVGKDIMYFNYHRHHLSSAKECLEECKNDSNCQFWDMDDANCRMLKHSGEGPKPGYASALAGSKNCLMLGEGPTGMYEK